MRNQKNSNGKNGQNNYLKVSEIKLSYKNKYRISDRPTITQASQAYDVFKSLWSDNIEFVEEFNVLLLNRANKVLGIVNISKGGVSGTVVDAKVIFSAALLSNASGVILAHNHPSGNTNPSDSDLKITRKLKNGGEFLDISVLDHLIITPEGFHSMAEEGQL